MDYKWEENLRELIEYINHNPDIIIRKGMVVIPPEKKTVFYDYFDRTGESFIKEYYGRFLIEAENLSLEYSSLEKQLITAKNKAHGNSLTGSSFLEAVKSKLVKPGIAKMEKIYLDEKLQMFLHQPLPCFTSLIFEELMNLLQQAVSPDLFKNKVGKKLPDIYSRLYQSGYILWVMLALLKKLKPKGYYTVGDIGVTNRMLSKYKRSGLAFSGVMRPVKKTMTIDMRKWRGEKLHAILHPDAIIETSSKTQRFVGIKAGIEHTRLFCENAASARPYLSFDKVQPFLGDNALLLYISRSVDDAAIVADNSRLWKPDMLLFIEAGDGWNTQEKLGKISQATELIKPHMGSFIILGNIAGNNGIPDLPENTKLINAGFNEKVFKNLL